MTTQVAIVVLNWNNAIDTLACLGSLATLNYPDHSVLVVDNGSTDDSVSTIRVAYPDVDIIETGENLGYAGGNNAGILRALGQGAQAICILNNDITVEPEFLASQMVALQARSDIGVVTPLVAEQDNGDRVWALGSAVDWRTAAVTRQRAGESVNALRRMPTCEVDVASGAAMLVKREVFDKVGLLDESFFLYYEEVDWCLKVRQVRFRILAVPSSVVWHKVSATLGTTSPIVDYYMLRNHLYLIGRHWPKGRRLYLLGRIVLRDLVTVAAYTLKSHHGDRTANRNARLLALRDAALGCWGPMGPDVTRACHSSL